MQIGLDGFAVPHRKLGAPETLDFVREQGLDGAFFGSISMISPTLDPHALRDVRDHANALGLYLEVGVGRINPTRFGEQTTILEIGDGDFRRGLERHVHAARSIGLTELRADLGGEAARFDPKVSWADQLALIRAFLLTIAPFLRDVGCRLNVETHADITTFELVRLIEDVGPDVLGVCFDTANVLCRAEDPVAATRRIAPYVHQTHVKDAILYFVDDGLMRQSRPCGEGLIDWEQVLPMLAAHAPDLKLSIEDHKGLFGLRIYDPGWQRMHPDLTAAELAELVRLTRQCERRVQEGEIEAPAAYEAIPWADHALERLQTSIRHLRRVVEKLGLASSI